MPGSGGLHNCHPDIRASTPGVKKDDEAYAFGDVETDFLKQEATKNRRTVRLSVKEFDVLKYLIQHEGEVVTRDMLLQDVWEHEHFPTTRTIDNYVLSLRKKLESEPGRPRHLLTIHTAGYKFVR